MAETAYIGLGSNIGDSMATLRSSLDHVTSLGGVSLISISGAWETTPVGPVQQNNYLNAAIALHTSLAARDLLDELLEIERLHGRERLLRWGPRSLDLDILLYGTRQIEEPGLNIPHPWLSRRLFVLEPLLEIAPDLVHPVEGRKLSACLDHLRSLEQERVLRVADLAPAPATE